MHADARNATGHALLSQFRRASTSMAASLRLGQIKSGRANIKQAGRRPIKYKKQPHVLKWKEGKSVRLRPGCCPRSRTHIINPLINHISLAI